MSRSRQPELFKPTKTETVHLNRFKADHGVGLYHAKNHTLGLPWSAFLLSYKGHGFMDLVATYSMRACEKKGIIAHGATPTEACNRLAVLQGWEDKL